MAFTTEFVMGAGGAEVEEIPVSMSGSGLNDSHPIVTVSAGSGAWVWVDGQKSGGPVSEINVSGQVFKFSSDSPRMGGAGYFTGNVPIALVTRGTTTTTFDGTVYVTRL